MRTVGRYFPDVSRYRITHAIAGVRPTIDEWGLPAQRLSSGYRIHDHTAEGVDGLYTVAGGKLSTHRLMAEEVTDLVCRRLKVKDESKTKLESLPGCTAEMPWREESRRTGLDPVTVKRLMDRHGYKALEILENARRQPELCRTLCECEQVLCAEVEYTVREEWAESLDDIARRTRLGTGACRSCRCATAAARFTGSLLGWSRERTAAEAADFAASRRRGTSPALSGEQAKQEEYARALALLSERGT
jgi:glycerol-3-phosphate dehydrogenase